MKTYTDMKDDTGLASAFWQNLLTLSDKFSMSLECSSQLLRTLR